MSEVRTALIIVDVQNDFCAGGSLEVPDGDAVVEPINKLLAFARRNDWLLVASRDWHPEHTVHFTQDRNDNKGWPVHCVQNTWGAQFHPGLTLDDETIIITKGTDPADDGGYSAFDGVAADGRSLEEVLRAEHIETIRVAGLATDYCVKETALDARRFGFRTILLLNAVRAVNLEPDDGQKALDEMVKAGIELATPPLL